MSSTLPPLPVPVIEAVAAFEDIDRSEYGYGYRPAIQWGGATLWEGDTLVPAEAGDYDHAQEAKAEAIANEHIVKTLRGLFRDVPSQWEDRR